MPQVVNTYILQICSRANFLPELLDTVNRIAGDITGKDVIAGISHLVFPVLKQRDSGLRKGHMFRAFLLCGVSRFGPDAALQVELIPGGIHHFAFSSPCQDQEADDVGGFLVGVTV